MWVSTLIFLIINFILLGLLSYCLVLICMDDKKRTVRKCNILDHENGDLKLSLCQARKALEKYKQKHPHASKFEIGQLCYGIVTDKVKQGKIVGIVFSEDGTIQYVIKQQDGKTIFVYEDHVLSENDLGGVDARKET